MIQTGLRLQPKTGARESRVAQHSREGYGLLAETRPERCGVQVPRALAHKAAPL